MLSEESIRSHFEAHAVDMGGELNGGSWSISGDMLDEAAHAIAEEMREGVVREAPGVWMPASEGHKGILFVGSDSNMAIIDGLPVRMSGKQRVHVTVWRDSDE
jgi:hypothetical protein